ncbi:hypothetical protein SAMN04487891_102287 [Flagellimonas taeanensis]|uniref:TonB-dependent Receptor Plug Domain n=1 Tax=Flagellimonas taeanensis TaxID=1005926 RepID=A0A1M6S2W4_9FLAO|nr:hypothetical protein [Allomuricauda taeanensis]SFB77636.1 hypothetical protein SAMN04487891_102287 [Allomuricauda taeanensis]SHK39011.1 hypothetical protein SAMN05216293_0966 [Allomuricauda taeanensis]
MLKHNPLLCVFSLFLVINILKAQNQITEKYRKYFEESREMVYLHVSKDIFLPEEEIWFKGYLYDQKKAEPSKISRTINVGIYDSLGVLKKEQLYYLNEGYFKGSVKVDSTFAHGRYFLKAKTNWMRNFNDRNSFIKEFLVVKSDIKVREKPLNLENLDFQFLPEGGNLVSGIKNIVGVKALDHLNKPLQLKNIEIVDEHGKQLVLMETNDLGLGKFEINPDTDTGYFAKVTTPSGQEVSIKMPKAYPKGINLNIYDNPYKEEVLVQVEANDLALENGDIKTNLVLHKDGEVISEPVLLSKKSKIYTIYFDKTKLMAGVNILTLFDEKNNPIEERQFFVWKGMGENRIEAYVAHSIQPNDSLEIVLNSKVAQPMGLSVSVLPKNTMAYHGSDNIYEQFYLRPYVKGVIENVDYYFTNTDNKKKYEMDLLLLTQGWSRYNWHEIINGKFQTTYSPVDGLNLYGFLNEKLKRESILIHKSIVHEPTEISLSSEQDKFLVTNFYPIIGENIFFSKKDSQGKLSKLDMYARLSDNYFLEDKIVVSGYEKFNMLNRGSSIIYEDDDDFELPELSAEEKLIALDNVTVIEQSKLEKEARNNLRVPRYLANKITVVDKELASTFNTVADLLRSKGYEIREDLQAFDGGSNAFISRFRIKSRRGGGVNMFLDDVLQPNLDVFYNMPLTQVESFYVDRISRYMGTKAGNMETVYIFLRHGEELNLTQGQDFMSRNSFKFKVDKGFEKQKEFYNPKFKSFTDSAFENFGLIHWEPLIWMDQDNNYKFKIPNYGYDKLKLVIEGMGEDGNLYSDIKILNAAKPN